MPNFDPRMMALIDHLRSDLPSIEDLTINLADPTDIGPSITVPAIHLALLLAHIDLLHAVAASVADLRDVEYSVSQNGSGGLLSKAWLDVRMAGRVMLIITYLGADR